MDSSDEREERQPAKKRRGGVKNHRNGAREERLRELRALRARVVELEQQLAALQITHRNRERRKDAGSSPMAQATTTLAEEMRRSRRNQPAEAAAVWKQLAARQLDLRLTSEGDNRRLKVLVDRQKKVTRALEKVLHSRATKETMDACTSVKRTRRIHSISATRCDPQLYRKLYDQIELAYAEVDDVFDANGGRPSMDSTYMGVFADKTLPFGVTDTGAAVWQLLAHNAEQSDYRFYFQNDSHAMEALDIMPEDIVVERFGVEIGVDSVNGDFNIRQVFRRYVEPDRIVVVWRSYIDPIEFKKVPLAGVRFSEKGYIVVKRPTSLPDFALLQTWYVVTPDTPADTFPELTEFVLSGSYTARAVQVIENILLQRSMQKGL